MKEKTDHTIRKSKYEHLLDLAIIKNISGKIVFKQVVKRINPMKNELFLANFVLDYMIKFDL